MTRSRLLSKSQVLLSDLFVRLLRLQFLSQDHKTGRIVCVLVVSLKWLICRQKKVIVVLKRTCKILRMHVIFMYISHLFAPFISMFHQFGRWLDHMGREMFLCREPVTFFPCLQQTRETLASESSPFHILPKFCRQASFPPHLFWNKYLGHISDFRARYRFTLIPSFRSNCGSQPVQDVVESSPPREQLAFFFFSPLQFSRLTSSLANTQWQRVVWKMQSCRAGV